MWSKYLSNEYFAQNISIISDMNIQSPDYEDTWTLSDSEAIRALIDVPWPVEALEAKPRPLTDVNRDWGYDSRERNNHINKRILTLHIVWYITT